MDAFRLVHYNRHDRVERTLAGKLSASWQVVLLGGEGAGKTLLYGALMKAFGVGASAGPAALGTHPAENLEMNLHRAPSQCGQCRVSRLKRWLTPLWWGFARTGRRRGRGPA